MTTTRHELKTHPEPFEATWNGIKLYEIRSEEDRRFEVGDSVLLREWRLPAGPREHTAGCRSRIAQGFAIDPARCGCPPHGEYTGREIMARITYVSRSAWGLPPGLVVFGIRIAAVMAGNLSAADYLADQPWAQRADGQASITYARRSVPLQPGESVPEYLGEDPPDGHRWETDAELRARIRADMGYGDPPGDQVVDLMEALRDSLRGKR